MTYPPFSLTRLLRTVFDPQPGERVAILIDLDDPADVKDFHFLKNPAYAIQRHAHDVFYQGLRTGVARELGLVGGEFFAYEKTGGSNLDLPDRVVASDGRELSFERDLYPHYNLILCISTYSATAPLTAFAKQYGFRGATMHGMNDIILASGLAVDYFEVSREAEALRAGMTRAERFEIDFHLGPKAYRLTLHLDGQEAQKSHGLCRERQPDIANLPAGEVYFVPTNAEGQFPHVYEDGTLAVLSVKDGRAFRADFVSGHRETVDQHNAKLKRDPVTGELGELGLGTQELPVSGSDIQDEKILGTFHVATGRSDHLGGHLTPDMFAEKKNATHDDILFAPHKVPQITSCEVRMIRDGQSTVIIKDFQPSAYVTGLLEAVRVKS
jgi:aminopeptidase